MRPADRPPDLRAKMWAARRRFLARLGLAAPISTEFRLPWWKPGRRG